MRRRILTAMVVVTAIAVVLFATPLAVALGDFHHEEEVVRLERTAVEAAQDVPANFPNTIDRFDVRLVEGREIGLYGRDGRRLAGGGPKQADTLIHSALKGVARDSLVGHRIVVAIPVTRNDRVVGALRASISDASVAARTRSDILLMIAIGVLVVGISALIGLRQSRRLARPVDQLARAADRLGHGDFTVRSEVSGIPEVDAVSASLAATAARLDSMLARERTFSEDASHQLRTPLTGLRVTLEAARLDPASDRMAAVATALESIDRLDRTIDDLLALAREAPTLTADTDLTWVLGELDEDWHDRVADADRALDVVVESDVPHVSLSDRAARQILDVLVDNALRHGSGTITVRARTGGSGAVVEVRDQGEGVGDARRIFDRRASTSGSHGIGLALARSLAEAEGARLTLAHATPAPIFTLVMAATAGPAETDLRSSGATASGLPRA